MLVVGDEMVVDIAIVIEMEIGTVQGIVVELLPGMFDESDSHVAEGG